MSVAVVERAMIAFREEGFLSFVVRSAQFAGRHVGIGVDRIEAHRKRLSRLVFDKYDGVVRYGPFSNLKLLRDVSWGEGELAAMLLGFYEKEVLGSILDVPKNYRTFIDIGAATGYYAVGLLRTGKFDRAICFEIQEYGRRVINRLAAHNDVGEQIVLLGGADEKFTNEIEKYNVALDECLVLIDIEGGEFSTLTEETLKILDTSILIIELHDDLVENGTAKLEHLCKTAQATHRVSRIFPGPTRSDALHRAG